VDEMSEGLDIIGHLLEELKRRKRKCKRLRRNLKIIAMVYSIRVDMEELEVK